MPRAATAALIGHTGFVGSNLARQHRFDCFFNSRNVEEIVGRQYQLLVVSAMPAEKWRANLDPGTDLGTLERLSRCLEAVSAEQAVLISTIDVYAPPLEVDEKSEVNLEALAPYGRHRRLLEMRFLERFAGGLILRLPAVFGPGLKKNALFDLLNNNRLDKLDPRSVYQWYDVADLWADTQKALALHLSVLNLATPPLGLGDLAARIFGVELTAPRDATPARYDFRTLYWQEFGGPPMYIREVDGIWGRLRSFVDGYGRP